MALATADPDAASVTAILNANATIKTAFGASPSIFAIEELGGSYPTSGGTGLQTTTETIGLRVNLGSLASHQRSGSSTPSSWAPASPA